MSKRHLSSLGHSPPPPSKRAKKSKNEESSSSLGDEDEDIYHVDSDVMETDGNETDSSSDKNNNSNNNSVFRSQQKQKRKRIKKKRGTKQTKNKKKQKGKSKSSSKSKTIRANYLSDGSNSDATSLASNEIIASESDEFDENMTHIVFIQSNNPLQGRNKTRATIYKHRNDPLGLQREVDTILARHASFTNNAKRQHCGFAHTTCTTTRNGKERVSKTFEIIDNWQIPKDFDWNVMNLCFVIKINQQLVNQDLKKSKMSCSTDKKSKQKNKIQRKLEKYQLLSKRINTNELKPGISLDLANEISDSNDDSNNSNNNCNISTKKRAKRAANSSEAITQKCSKAFENWILNEPPSIIKEYFEARKSINKNNQMLSQLNKIAVKTDVVE